MKTVYYPVKKRTILLVDDDQVAVHINRAKFEERGFKVKVAVSSESAVACLKEESIDVVILDLCLAGMDGIDTIRKMRSSFPAAVLPIIILANAYLGKLVRTALEAGATKCVEKAEATPARMLELVADVLAMDHSVEVGSAEEAAGSNAIGGSPVATETELQQKLIETMLMNVPEHLAKLRTALQALTKTTQPELAKAQLSEMHQQIRAFAGCATLLPRTRIGQMVNAMEALLFEVHAETRKMTPSVVWTLAQAIDALARLFDHAASNETGLSPPRILVVDDEIISREMVSTALARADLAAVSLDDPLTALDVLEREHFDLIFLDLEMPGLRGLELCSKIREKSANRATPVVFVTAHSDFDHRAQSVLKGGNDFIAKPFLLVELAVKALTLLFGAKAKRTAPEPASCLPSGGIPLQPSLVLHPSPRMTTPAV